MVKRDIAMMLAGAAALAFGSAEQSARADTLVDAPLPIVAKLHVWYGTVKDAHGGRLELTLRTGRVIVADVRDAAAKHHVVLLTPTRPVIVRGVMRADGIIATDAVLRWHGTPANWLPDQ